MLSTGQCSIRLIYINIQMQKYVIAKYNKRHDVKIFTFLSQKYIRTFFE